MKNYGSVVLAVVLIGSMVTGLSPMTRPAQAVSPSIVISQVYGGGGNAGATLKNDFIELFNRGTTAVDITGWSVQYASSAGNTWAKTDISGILQPGQYYLIQEAAGSGGTTNLPPPDAVGSIAMSASSGKVALVANQTLLTCGSLPGNCFPNASINDFVGYGAAANNFEGAGPTGTLTNTTAAIRTGAGCTDTDNNTTDFAVTAPIPRNTASPYGSCGDAAPEVASTNPSNGATSVPVNTDLVVTFSEPVNVTGAWFGLTCTISGIPTAVVTGGPTTFTINPDTDFAYFESCTLTIYAANVTDQDSDDPPDNMVANYVTSFSTGDVCASSFTHIYSIQGSGATAAITGTVTTQGVVVGDYEGASPRLRGFYLQDETGDGNAATSDGIFVYNASNDNVSLGDVVRVSGLADEYQGQTQISGLTAITKCTTGSVTPVDVTLPVSSTTFLEQYEGMLVRLQQTLYVTEHYQLGRFGQVVMSSGDRLQQPTSIVGPGAPALALQAANNLNRIIIDDALNNQNPDPILFGRGGLPLSASNTLRGGDTATNIIGVLTYTWGGHTDSPNAYRVRPVNSLGSGVPSFQAVNLRPSSAPAVGGVLKVAGMNLLNFFNTFADGNPSTPGCFPSGTDADCRGANSADEFARQWPKTVAAILSLNPDVLGVNELENDGYSPESAIQFLVSQLNAATSPGTYAFIDVDSATGQVNAMGTDAIKVGLIYKPAKVTPVGQTAVLNSAAFVTGGDSAARNRPSLAQAFQQNSNGARFIVDVNHLKSKGSACDTPDAGDGQGNCNIVRTNAATELINWLATNPTESGDPDILLIGDYNSYAMEDPITTIKAAGFTNLIESVLGSNVYSYVFDGQWGYLDHALASASLLTQVSGVADYHINADEPSVLDYNTNFKSAGQIISLYAPDEFRASDHDPVVIGLNLTHSIMLPLVIR